MFVMVRSDPRGSHLEPRNGLLTKPVDNSVMRRAFLLAASGLLVPEWLLDPPKGRAMVSVPASCRIVLVEDPPSLWPADASEWMWGGEPYLPVRGYQLLNRLAVMCESYPEAASTLSAEVQP